MMTTIFLSDDASTTCSDHTATVSYSSDVACDLASIANTSILNSSNKEEIRKLKLRLKNKNCERKTQLASRLNKYKKHPTAQRTNYLASNKNQQYLTRSKLYFDKLRTEMNRKGHFVLVFPRRTTWHMYNFILEDVGQEKWDEDLHNRCVEKAKMDGSYVNIDVTMADISNAHYQLMNAGEFKSKSDLSPIVGDVLLQEAFANAKRYKMRMYPKDIIPYPSSLPRVRDDARRRTRSQMESEKERDERIRERRKQLLEQQCASVDDQKQEQATNHDQTAKDSMNDIDFTTRLPIHQILPLPSDNELFLMEADRKS